MLIAGLQVASCKFCVKKFYCIDPQHSRLVTWLQTKNENILRVSFKKDKNVKTCACCVHGRSSTDLAVH